MTEQTDDQKMIEEMGKTNWELNGTIVNQKKQIRDQAELIDDMKKLNETLQTKLNEVQQHDTLTTEQACNLVQENMQLKELVDYISCTLIHIMWKHAYPEYQIPLIELQAIASKGFEIEPQFGSESPNKDGSDAVEMLKLIVTKDGKWCPPPSGYHEIYNLGQVAESKTDVDSNSDADVQVLSTTEGEIKEQRNPDSHTDV